MELLSQSVLERIEDVLDALRPEELLAQYKDAFDEAEWAFVREYARDEIRSTLEIGAMLRSVLDVAEGRGLVSPSVGRRLRSHQGFRTRNFGIADERDERFMAIALDGPGAGLVGELERARQLAEERFFDPDELSVTNPPPLGKREVVEAF